MRLSAILAVLALTAPAVAQVNISQNDTQVSVTLGGKPLLEYAFAQVPFKPYVKVLTTPSGINVLRDSPADHKHHHALMFAIGAGGVNFWAETPTNGKQLHDSFGPVLSNAKGGEAQASLAEILSWRSAAGDKVLDENRSIRINTGADLGASLLTWKTSLKSADPDKPVKLTGSHYFGLGARFRCPWTRTGSSSTRRAPRWATSCAATSA